MTEQTRRKPAAERPAVAAELPARDGDEAERLLGRAVAAGLPLACIGTAILVGLVASVGSAVLVLASGALLGAIALLWASVRTLTGDAPLPTDLEALAGQNRGVDALSEHKRRVLLALKDLQSEHALGKIDDADYEEIAARYREQAKAVMREMDLNVAPAIAEAEQLAREYLATRGLGPTKEAVASPPQVGMTKADARARRACASCATSNEPDAAFCKKCGSAMTLGDGTTAVKNDATA